MNAYKNTRSLRHCASLAQASEYNLFILTNVEQRNSDIEGRAAVGGDALFSSFSVGSKLCNALTPCPLYGTDPTLVVGGNLTWTDGSNFSGNTVLTPSGIYSATSVAYQNANSHLQPMRRSGLNEDIETAFAYFRSAAKQWTNFTSLPNTTTIINCNGNVFMIGLNQDINIFRINATQVAPTGNVIGTGNNTFDTLSSLTIIAPDNSTILINVNGANIDFGNYAISRNTVFPATLPILCNNIEDQLSQGITPNEGQKKQIFWNFYNADTIVTANSSFQGSVFAPFATIYTAGGTIEGSVIAKALLPYGTVANHTEIRNYLFSGCLPFINYSFTVPTSSSTTTGCTTSTSTTTGCTTSSSTSTSCPTSSSTSTSCTSSSYTTWSFTTSSYTTSSSTTSCPTSSSTTTSCPTSSSTTTSCPTSSYTTSSSTTTNCPTSSSTTSSCTTSSYTTTNCPTSSYTTSSSTTSCSTSSYTTSSCTTSSSTTTSCPTSSSTTTSCPTSSSTTSSCTTSSSTTTSCPTSSSTTTNCPTSSSTTSSCTTSSSTTTSCPTSSSTSSSSTSTSCTTSSHTTSSCTTSSYTSSSSTSSSYTTSSCTTWSHTTWSHTTWSHTTWSHTTWSHTTWTFTTPNTSSTTTTPCSPRNIHYCPRCNRRTTAWRFSSRIHHYCFYCGYYYTEGDGNR